MCGEMIVAGAAKCRFCDAVFDENLRRSEKKQKRGGFSSDDERLTALDWVLCIFLGNIACIVGIVYLCLGKPKAGKMIGTAVAFYVGWVLVIVCIGVISAVVENSHGPRPYQPPGIRQPRPGLPPGFPQAPPFR
jgi:hypothetical protein